MDRNFGNLGGNPGNQRGGNHGTQRGGNHGNQRGGNANNRGGNHGNRGGNQGNRGGNQGNRGGNQGNRGGNQENRGGNQGNRGGNQGNRGGHQENNRGGHQRHGDGAHGNRDGHHGNRENWRGNRDQRGGGHDGNRGGHQFRGPLLPQPLFAGPPLHFPGAPQPLFARPAQPNLYPGPPQMDWFNLRQARDQSEDRRSQHSLGNGTVRRDYGGRYGSNTSLNLNQRDEQQNRNRGGGDNRPRQRRNERSNMGFKKLEELSNMEPDRLVITLTNENTGLEKLFQTNLSNDYIVLILRVLNRLCESTFSENKARVLATVCQQDFMSKLNLYLSDICIHDRTDKMRNRFFWEEQENFWKDLLNFYENIIKIIPNTGCEVLPKLVKRTCISVANMESEQKVIISGEIKERLEELQEKIMLCVEEREKKQVNKNVPEDQDDRKPPNDFRQISLYPTINEITNREEVFMRQNKVEGKYNSVEHYLDVQFRLLREDFVAPLRDGICDYLESMNSRDRKRIFNVRIYKDVRFIKKHTIQDKVTLIVQLAVQKKKIKLENSRRFMFGSLICFTNDNFKTIIFGTVAGRDRELFENGQIAVDILDNTVNEHPYTMVECGVYFEPYYHVLKALQMMTEEKFPLQRYIIDVLPDVKPPSYYNYLSVIQHQQYRLYPLVPQSWPGSQQLGLDPSQYKAFQAALSKEFCVIQGPPGTGKTFIGLKVAQVLLENVECWNNNRCPILVICFTNHALDQFLEGILQYTQKLVRIGGQSKSEKLKGHNIRDMRTRGVRTRDSAQLMMKKKSEIRESMNLIHSHQTLLDAIFSCERIINFKSFEAIDENIKNSWFSKAKPADLVEWLVGGRTQEERYEERRRNRIAQIQAQMERENKKPEDSDSEDEFFDAEFQEERGVDDRDEIVIKTENIDKNSFTIKTLHQYAEKIRLIELELATIEMKAEEENAYNVYDEKGMKQEELDKTRDELAYLQWRMDQFKSNNAPPLPRIIDYKKPEILTPNERWGLYFNWLRLYRAQLNEDLVKMDANYRRLYREFEEVRQIEDTQVMREMLVIGMTTTGAARYQSLLQALKCPIVIVEEAAEVLESHVVVSLTSDCKHLILIGDHQQLRPTTAEFRLAKKYHLDISLFERMVNNKIHCEQLEVQHRMRPEIARLIVPAIYPKLENHRSVESYPPIHGITKNLFFITHKQPEEAVADTGSRKNVHEAKFLIKLARHLILQGYEAEEITILATYSGQLFCLMKEKRLYSMLKDVRITVVDNFQGEENKIILLSLVRSNEEENVGFLKTDNRVCVALSRAKEGMYIMGNMDILEKSSHVWREIKSVLDRNGQFDTHLTLQCQVHRDQLTRVAFAEDFHKVTEGGCTQLCGKQLDCGHICSNLCHIIDREHVRYKCKKKCQKILCELDHPCPDLCFEECKPCRVPMLVTLKCGHSHSLPCHMQDTSQYLCPTLVDVELECGHHANKPCHKDVKKYPCPHPCEIRMLCGHACTRKCHVHPDQDPDHLQMRCFKPCERIKKDCSRNEHKCMLSCYQECQICEVKVKKTRTCGHVYEISCSANVEDIECKRRCKKKLECGHNCRENCCDPCGNCEEKVTKVIPVCNHKVKMKCFETPDRSKCREKCPRQLICGHSCDKRCNEPCQLRCEALVDNPHNTACGHTFKIPCYKVTHALESTSYDLLQHCTEPCGVQLMCEHTCSGTCGTCAQGRVHMTCREQCGRTLVCNHACDIPCREMCQPCNKRCSYRCAHNRCGKKCGEPCVSCKERCTRVCPHVECRKTCGAKCSVPPCTKPCPKLLKCKHPCIGFCGDPCPPLCRICDPENDAFTIMFGNEDDPEARFVYLEECKHIIESDAMDMWLNQTLEGTDVKEIQVKHCPKCKTILAYTQRYSEFIKDAYNDINQVKLKWFGQEEQNEESRVQLQLRISEVKNINRQLYIQSKFLKPILLELQSILQNINNGKRNPVNIMLMNKCNAQVEILGKLIKIYHKGEFTKHDKINSACIERLDFLFSFMQSENCRFTDQEVFDLGLESKRFEKIVQLLTIEKSPYFNSAMNKSALKRLYENIRGSLYSPKKYSDLEDVKNRENLKTLGEAVDKSIKLEEHELKMVIQAMKMGVGHWYKCPNGHLYVIADCGRAVMRSRCNECNAVIGGSGHQSAEGNQRTGLESKHFQPKLHDLQRELKEKHKGKRNPLNIISIISCKSQIELIEALVNIFNTGELENNENLYKTCLNRFDFILELMHDKNGHISKQKASDIELEINRFERLVQICRIEKNSLFKAAFSDTKIKVLYIQIYNILHSIQRYSETSDKALKVRLENLADMVDKTMKISDEERKSIVKAMQESKEGLGTGRWFKCPNGHYFAIGACGGAMEEGKCNECGEKIGGRQHTLLSTNQFAGEMDGAAHPAWSDAANMDMRNFQF